MEVAPTSVSFWTIHSGRSPFGMAQSTRAADLAGTEIGSDSQLSPDAVSLAVAQRPAPSLIVTTSDSRIRSTRRR
jgi:hypothetical protein